MVPSYLFSVSRNGVVALELQRHLGVTYKTAWRMAKQIRTAMDEGNSFLLKGIVEADEAYVGGRRRSSNRFKNKTPILGAVKRNGRVLAKVVPWASTAHVTRFLVDNVIVGSELQTYESLL
jgi:transposase